MRIYYKLLGGHYHCRVFFNGLAGSLVVGEREWTEFRNHFGPRTTFYEDNSDQPVTLPDFASELVARLEPLARIADKYDSNDLDDEARKHWGSPPDYNDHVNTTPPEKIELYTGRGGGCLLHLGHCIGARDVLSRLGKWKRR